MPINNHTPNIDKSLEQWLWDAACSIRGAKEAAKYKGFHPAAGLLQAAM